MCEASKGRKGMKRFIKKVASALALLFVLSFAFSSVSAVYADSEPKYTDDQLYAIYDEIVADYMSDYDSVPIVMAVGVSAAEINGVVTGFGPNGDEKRVVISVRYEYFEEYKAMFEKKYGDAVYVEYTQDSKDAYEAQDIVFDEPEEDVDVNKGDEATEERGTGTNATTQIVVGAVLVVAAVGIFFLVRKKK